MQELGHSEFMFQDVKYYAETSIFYWYHCPRELLICVIVY